MLRHAQTVLHRVLPLLAGVAGLFLLATSAQAQDTGALHPGARMRIRYGAVEPPYEGRLVSLTRDSLVLALGTTGEALMAIPREAVAQAWVRAGQQRETVAGMFLGMLAGAAVGAGVAAIAYEPCHAQECIFHTRGAMATAAGGVFGGLGLVVGGIAGFCTHSPDWQPVALPITALSIDRGRRAVALTVRARF